MTTPTQPEPEEEPTIVEASDEEDDADADDAEADDAEEEAPG